MVRAEREKPEIFPPTSLNLFDFKRPGNLQRGLGNYREVSRLIAQFSTNLSAIDKFWLARPAQHEKLTKTGEELQRHSSGILRSVSFSALYLTMYDELQEMGVAPADIWAFFRKFVSIPLYTFDSIREQQERDPARFAQKVRGRDIGFRNIVGNTSFLMRHLPMPAWFGKEKGEGEWLKFISDRMKVGNYLGDFFGRYPHLLRPSEQDMIWEMGSDGLPDWFEETNGNIPDRSLIEEELSEDIKEVNAIEEMLPIIKRQQQSLMSIIEQKLLKAVAFLEQRRGEVFPVPLNLESLILYLFLLSTGYDRVELTPNQIISTSIAELPRHVVPFVKEMERSIQAFVQSADGAMSKESVALWIESALRSGLIMARAGDPLNEDTSSMLFLALSESRNRGGRSEEMQRLREERKRTFNALNHDLRPFLELLSDDEVAYLKEFVSSSQGEPLESVIWEMAEAIASHKNQIEERQDALSLQTAFRHLKIFLEKWLKGNWRWTFTSFLEGLERATRVEYEVVSAAHEVLERITEALTVFLERGEDEVTLLPPSELPYVAPAQELREAVEGVAPDNLSGWRIYYTTDRSTNNDSLFEIEGETLSEREEKLADFIGTNNISCSISPGSIIRAFDWLVTVPQEVEWTRIRKEVDGEVFRKLKRGDVRIFYVLDREAKKIIFFVHQKKAFSYGF